MDKIAFKKKVLDKAREKQQNLIDDFSKRISEMRTSEVKLHEEQFDLGQQSNNDYNDEMINHLADELNFVKEEMKFLNKMQVHEQPLDKVTLGAIVKTDKRIFFPSVSIEAFKVDDQEIFGISEHAPIYPAMKGKIAGEQFSFGNITYSIEEVY